MVKKMVSAILTLVLLITMTIGNVTTTYAQINGINTHIDLTNEMTQIPSVAWSRDITEDGYKDGAPIGGLGAGTVTWRYDGEFYKGRLDIGSNKLTTDDECSFYMYQKTGSEDSSFKKLDSDSIGEDQAKYYSLFPKSWVDYYGDEFDCKARVTQFTPIIPEDYQRTSYPVGVYKWDITNPTDKVSEVGIMLSWKNEFSGSNVTIVEDGNKEGIVLKNSEQQVTEETHGEFTLASEGSSNVTVSYASNSDISTLEDDFSADGKLENNVGNHNLGGICFNAVLQPGESVSVPIILSWDIPIAKAGLLGDKWYKRYTRFFGRDGNNSWNIANETLDNYLSWEESIDNWQDEIISNNKYPDWLKTALFNELYYYFTGGTYWESGAASGQVDNPDEDMFTHLETYAYKYYGTLDVRFYGSWPLLFYWPEIEKQCMRQFSDSVYTTRTDRPKPIGTAAHDFGTYNNVFQRWNAYTFRDTTKWKDLNAKLVLCLYRDWALTGKTDTDLLNYSYQSINIAMDKLKSQDSDGDMLPNSYGTDQTYDNMDMKGNASYNAGLLLAACQAAKEISLVLGEEQKALEYQNWYDTAKASMETKLWNGEYYKIDTDSKHTDRIIADQLCGEWYARATGIPDIISNEHAISSLKSIYKNNFQSYYNSSAGAVNVANPDGSVDTSSQQTEEVWTGVNWDLASTFLQYGLIDEAEDLAFSIYNTIYNKNDLCFRTPEAWTDGGKNIRAPYYMRATAVWAMKQAYDKYGVAIDTDANIAKGKNVIASSDEAPKLSASNAFDGNLTTRWSSQSDDPEWIKVDLGDNYLIDRVKLYWEYSCAKEYKIQTSHDGIDWEDVYLTSKGNGGIDNIEIDPVNARYVRLYNLKRKTKKTYSLYEIEVYGEKSEYIPEQDDGNVEVWFSSEKNPKDAAWFEGPMDITYKLDKQKNLFIEERESNQIKTLEINPGVKYQTIYGMGNSIEESTVYNLSRMSSENREEILRKLIDPEYGIGINIMRICFGSSDFTGEEWYSYDDMPKGETDLELEHFSIQKDFDYNIIQTIKQALEINPDMKILASPWSPPAWMKNINTMCGSNLKGKYYDVAAKYYRKCIEAYEAEGIPIWAFTIQNEPHGILPTYPGCGFTWWDEVGFVQLIKSEFEEGNIDAKVMVLDHNFAMAMSYGGNLLKDEGAYKATDGVAFHDYRGEPTDMTTLHNEFPEKEMFLTERSTWGTWGANRIVEYFRNWACSYNAWVTMLDSDKKPNKGPYNADPTYIIQNASDYDDYWYTPEYYLMGQFSKFVQSGAKRIYSDFGSTSTITNVAFLNPDNTIVVVAVNQTDSEQIFNMNIQNNKCITACMPPKTVATYKWNADLPVVQLSVPGKIEGEMYSSMKDVGLQDCSESGLNVSWIGTGDWMDYEVTVDDPGKYVVEYRIASHDDLGKIQMKSGDSILSETAFGGTGGWQNWATVVDTVTLSEGDQTIRIYAAENGFNLNWFRLTKAEGEPEWFQNFENWNNATSGKWSTVALSDDSANIQGKQSAKLDVKGYGDPKTNEKCVNAILQSGDSIDISNQSFFNFFVKDTQGNNTVKVTFVDSYDQVWSEYTNTKATKNQWAKLSMPVKLISGIDKKTIKEIRLGEYNQGIYYFDDLFFSDSSSTDVPEDWELPVTPITSYNVPGIIEGENYYDMYSVDTQICSEGGMNVCWIGTGDWMDYNIDVKEAGEYVIEYRLASKDFSGKIQLKVEDEILANTPYSGTGGWQKWSTIADTVTLKAGPQRIRIYAAENGFNLNWFRFSEAEGEPIWYQNFEAADTITAGSWSEVSLSTESASDGGDKCVKLDIQGYGDPMSYEKCVNVKPQTNLKVDVSNQSYFNFNVKDTQGYNTIRVTFVDENNKVWSEYTNGKAVKNQWTTISMPMNIVTGIDKTQIKEIRLGEFNSGTYYFDNLYFTNNPSSNIPADVVSTTSAVIEFNIEGQ